MPSLQPAVSDLMGFAGHLSTRESFSLALFTVHFIRGHAKRRLASMK
jgi:hypothetical protein